MADIAIGLMSGTSLDGIDACAVEFDGTPRLLARASCEISAGLRRSLLWLATGQGEIHDDPIDVLGHSRRQLSDSYALAVERLPSEITRRALCVGAHGQTIRHRPEHGFSLQIIDAARLSERLKKPVVADFRSADIALGGQGAPLVPAFHLAAFGPLEGRSAIVNLGGISNVTVIDSLSHSVLAGFDTGPGNRLLDDWISHEQHLAFDDGGRWAAQGTIDETLVGQLLAEPFFAQAAPKSSGREGFNLAWLQEHLRRLGRAIPAVDVQASLARVTAASIAQAIKPYSVERVICCGGGVLNHHLMSEIRTQIAPVSCQPSDEAAGIDPWAVEAMAFAWLAWRRWHAQPGTVASATGAHSPAICGAVYLPSG